MKSQYLAAFSANLLTLIYGTSVGWTAPNIILFQSEKSPVGKLTTDELSPIPALLCVGGVMGTIIFGWATDKMGRKNILLFLALPEIVAFVLVLVGDHVYYIYAFRFLAGMFGGGFLVVVPIFVSEIADPKIRGVLGSFLVFFCNLGILLGFILSSMFDYTVSPYFGLVTLGVFLAVFSMIPESPEFLIMKKRQEAAERSFKFYNGISRKKKLPSDLQMTYNLLTNFVQKQSENKKSTCQLLKELKQRSTCWGFVYSMILIIFACVCGSFVALNYLTFLFQEASIGIDIYLCTILCGIFQIFGSCISLLLVDNFGRRPLLIWSAFGAGLLLIVCAVYFYLVSRPEYSELVSLIQWLPLIALSGFIFVCNVGITSLPFFMISELLPVHLRGLVSTIALATLWLIAFALLQFFYTLVAFLGIHGTLAFFAACCFTEIAFVYYFLPETKGISFQEIQAKLYDRKL